MRSAFTTVTFTAVIVAVLSTFATAESKIGFRQITVVEPVAVQCGTDSPVTLRSNFTLDGTHAAFVVPHGVSLTFAEDKPIVAARRGRGSDGTPFRFDVSVPKEQSPGVYEVRIATKQAVSSVSHLLVTEFPVVQEDPKADNNSIARAQNIPIPAAVCGRVERFEDVDFFKINGKAGQRIGCRIYAQSVTEGVHGMVVRGPLIYLMDSLLTLYTPNGQVAAQNDNFIGGDAFIDFTFPRDGEYFLEVRDARYAGSGRYVYCVEVFDRPHLHAVFPLAVQKGQSKDVIAIGLVKDGTKVKLAGDKDSGWKNARFTVKQQSTNPVEVLVSSDPQVVATSENDSLKTAVELPVPAGGNGWLQQRDQTHFYSFAAKKGEYLKFQLTSARLGLPLDGVLTVYDAKGKELATADDGLQTRDPLLYWQAPTDGNYFVSVEDLQGRGGPRFVYHLEAVPSGPDFELQGEYYYSQLAPGTNMIWFAKVKRLNGFDGPIEIHVENLPAGVDAEPVTIPAGMNHSAIILKCALDAKIGATLARIIGRATVTDSQGDTSELVRSGRITCEQQSSGGGQARWPIQTSIVGVTEPLDLLQVTATPVELQLKPGEQAEIKVRIQRNKDFKDPVTLAMSFDYFKSKFGEQLPPGVTVDKKSQLRLAGKATEATIILQASKTAVPVQRLPIAVLARVSITFSITTNYASNPIYLTIPATTQTAGK